MLIFSTTIVTRCKKCWKDVKVKEIYIAESGAINLYYSCGHQNHDFELKLRKEAQKE